MVELPDRLKTVLTGDEAGPPQRPGPIAVALTC